MRKTGINVGDVVVCKQYGRCTVVETGHNTIHIETDGSGPRCCCPEDVTLPRDQTPVGVRMRFRMPYLTWRCADGTEVLANRNYRPILIRRPGQPAVIANGDEDVPYIECRWHFDDATQPWASKKTAHRLDLLLDEWGFSGWNGEGLNENHKKRSGEDLVIPPWAKEMWAAIDGKSERGLRTYHHYSDGD